MKRRYDLLVGFRSLDVLFVFAATLGLIVIVYVLLAMLEGGAFVSLMNDARAHAAHPHAFILIAADYAALLFVFAGIYLFGLLRLGLSWEAIGFRRCPFDWIVRAALLVPMVYGLRLMFAEVIEISGVWESRPKPPMEDEAIILATGSTPLIVALFILVAIVSSVAGEAFNRGVLFGWLRRHLTFVPSAVLSSIVFGVTHIDIAYLGATVIFGVIAAWLYEHSRSLWPPIVLHAGVGVAYMFEILNW